MKRLLRWVGGLLLVVVLLAGVLFVHVWYFKPARIDWFYARTFAQFALNSPEMLSSLRVLPGWLDFYGDKLDDASLAHEAEQLEFLQRAQATLRRYDPSSLQGEARLSYDVLDYYFDVIEEGTGRFRDHGFPVNQMSGVHTDLPDFMTSTHQVNDLRDARHYVARLRLFPRKFDQVLEGLELRQTKHMIPPRFAIDKVLGQMRNFVAPAPRDNPLYTSFVQKLDKLPAGAIEPPMRDALLADVAHTIEHSVYPAYQKLIAHFTALAAGTQANDGAWSLPDGEAYYAWCVRLHTTTDMTPAQVHALGLSEVARIAAEMEPILQGQGLTEGSVGMRVQQLAQHPDQRYPDSDEGRTAMLAEYQRLLDEIDAGIGAAFDVRPKLGVEVRAVPAYAQEGKAGAYYQPGSFDGSRPGLFYANMRDPGATPRFAMRTLAYHEGIPGHHFQIAIAQELKGLPFFRRILGFTAYAEGWALYAERLAWEMGFEQAPLDNLGRLRDEMLRAVRLVVDSGIHHQRWTRERAIAYMLENTGMAESDVVAEIERYFVMPGQALAYKAGMLKILELRERARERLGDRFDLRAFHNQVLTHGSLPLGLLERVIDDWIAGTAGAQ
ncbi:MAG TPA: DUF885 domain-containing protein [Dokdonella sp.]|uniref:DUF885 domain-containing protein n=1 Tax=Dokdonella sp. TaxID=2291710 RepID=UPI002C7D4DE8|nr:DUF885 domain-containing protein [Dokdonella sp.]HUD41588.1 DUF885 domain-containing protein [Dokdonella sp.]